MSLRSPDGGLNERDAAGNPLEQHFAPYRTPPRDAQGAAYVDGARTVSFAERTGVLPVLDDMPGPRTELAGLKGRTWPTTSQSNSIRRAARCCLTVAGERSRVSSSV